MKPKIITTTVNAAPRKLNAKWSVDIESWGPATEPNIDIKTLTEEEQAELIVKKLSDPPRKPFTTEQELADRLAKHIADEIDAELFRNVYVIR